MKTLEWQNFFADQRAQHGKVVFSVAELANAAQTSLHAVKTFQIDKPDPVAAIRFRMEQQALGPKDLVPSLGSRSRVSNRFGDRHEGPQHRSLSLDRFARR